MTNQNYPIGSIEWLNAMKRDFSLNSGKPTPQPVVFDRPAIDVAAIHSEIARLRTDVARLTEVARLLVGECEEQRECPVCGIDTNVEVCRPSCYVAKMRKVLDDKKGGG